MKKPNPFIIGLLILATVIILFFSYQYNKQEKLVAVEDEVLGTNVILKAYGRDVNKTRKSLQKALDEMHRIDQKYDIHHKDSELSKLNKQAGQKSIEISEELYALINDTFELGRKTKYSYNPAIWPLVDFWNFKQRKEPPGREDVKKYLNLCDPESINFDSNLKTVSLDDGQAIDLGGVLKGYAVDKAKTILINEQISRALIDAGSSQAAIGRKPNNKFWRIGIQNPDLDDLEKPFIGYLELNYYPYVSTTGDYQQFFVYEGKKYHHILSSKTGWPVNDYRSVTILSQNSAFQADLLSTAVFAAGYPSGLKLLKKFSGVEAIFVLSDGKIKTSSSNLEDLEELLNKI